MKKNILSVLSILIVLAVWGVISIDAQINPLGKYDYVDKVREGNPMNSTLEIRDENTVAFTYISVEDDYETKTRPGTWSYDKTGKLLTVALPAITDNENKGDDKRQTYTFRFAGGNLKFVKSLYEDNLVGSVYKKLGK